MVVRRVLILAFSIGVLVACNSAEKSSKVELTEAQKSEKQELVKSVMAVHDEAMAWMEEIHSLKMQMDSLEKSTQNDSLISVCTQQKESLENADEAMMAWMRQYREPEDSIGMESIKAYLSKEQEKINAVHLEMSTAMENAKTVLQ